MKTRISVIIPIYNVHEFLEDCIESVLAQTINHWDLTDDYQRNLQIILVDDGSTDDSGEIAKSYAAKYENVEYRYEENQGLGHARNYGCEFAEGDYIIFIDSDDIIPPKAYERMYRIALKNDSDLTIGSVWRFNSKLTWASNIHEIAFGGTKELTHIKESPELFYDTTAWNKLIKFSFWKEHGFQFPEGILYEDIPVTMPMHYLANNVSIVYENCYLWRVRDGISKSITQTTDDLKNVEDRLYVMGLVDKFFNENVTEEELHRVKNLKWIKNDLMIFINKLKSMDIDESQEIIDLLLDYIDRNIDPKYFDEINEIEKLKYEYLFERDFDRLLKLLNYEHVNFYTLNIHSKGSDVVIEGDKDVFKTSSFIVNDFIKEGKKAKYIQKVNLEEEALEVSGFVVIPGLEAKEFKDVEYSFYLVNSENRKKIALRHEQIYLGNINSYRLRFGKKFSYKAAGYTVFVPYELIEDNEDFLGENKIIVVFKQRGVTHNIFAGNAKKNVRSRSENRAILIGKTYMSIGYDKNNEIIINVSKARHSYDRIEIEDDDLCIFGPYDGDVFLHYNKSFISSESNIPFAYDDGNQCYRLDLDNIRSTEGQILYDNGESLVYKDKELLCLYSSKGQCVISSLLDHNIKINKFKNFSLVSKISERNNEIDIVSRLHSLDLGDRQLKSATLYFFLDKNQSSYPIAEAEIKDASTTQDKHIDDNAYIDDKDSANDLSEGNDFSSLNGENTYELKFKFNMDNKIITENLYHGYFDLLIRYDFGDLVFSTPIHLLDEFKAVLKKRVFHYTIYRGNAWTLRIRAKKKWNWWDGRPRIYTRAYRVFKHLPINKKRIMFESMWGAKYSCNPRYLYEYIDENHPDYECIWSLNDEHIPINGNGTRVRRWTLKYFYYLATSKYFVDNVNFNERFEKREPQRYVQTMHGTPLKTLGLDVPGDFPTKASEERFIERCSRWDYITVQSEYVEDIARSCFKFDKDFLRYGYPRTSMLYTMNNEEDINKIKERLNIPLDKKVILYAPTWRKKNKVEIMLDFQSFKESLSDDYILILRLHHLMFSADFAPIEDDFVYDLSRHDSIEELYLISDILITDYSSVMFDYSILDRPIILFAYDLEDYAEKLRGFYIDIQENKPGPILFSSKEVEDAISNIEKTEEDTKYLREEFRNKFIPYECANSSEKIFNDLVSGK